MARSYLTERSVIGTLQRYTGPFRGTGPLAGVACAAPVLVLIWCTAARAEGELVRAVCRGDLAEVKRLVAASPASVNDALGYDRITPLMDACRHGRLEIAKLLLEHGARVNQRGRTGFSALTEAARHGSAELATLLIESGAAVEPKPPRSSTPLIEAAERGHLKCATVLLDRGADVAAVDYASLTAAAKALGGRHVDCLQLLLARMKGGGALLAAWKGDLEALKSMRRAEAGSVLRPSAVEKWTPLHVAALAGKAGAVAWLLGAGTDVDATDLSKRTPLHMALFLQRIEGGDGPGGTREVVDRLVRAGADVLAADKWGLTALHRAARAGDGKIVDVLVRGGAALDPRDGKWRTPLYHAIGLRKFDAAKALLAAGADVNAGQWSGWTPLHLTAHHRDLRGARLLLDAGALTRVRDMSGKTPAEQAKEHGAKAVEGAIKDREAEHPEAAKSVGPTKDLTAATRLRTIRALKGDTYALILVPIGKVDITLLHELQPDLRKMLGIPVLIETVELGLPPPEEATRRRGKRVQWDVKKLLLALRGYVGDHVRHKIGCLGVTGEDLYATGWNCLFSMARPGAAVMSYDRFRSGNRAVLLKRARNQAISSTGLLFRIRRCKEKLCPRSYPRSVADHDVKGNELCEQCRRGFTELFGVSGEPLHKPTDSWEEDIEVF